MGTAGFCPRQVRVSGLRYAGLLVLMIFSETVHAFKNVRFHAAEVSVVCPHASLASSLNGLNYTTIRSLFIVLTTPVQNVSGLFYSLYND